MGVSEKTAKNYAKKNRKKRKKIFACFATITQFYDLFSIELRFVKPVLSSAQCAQNKHKNNWRAQATLLDVLSNDIMRKSKRS